jgi:capsular exopolysaccharide synthesis family protein
MDYVQKAIELARQERQLKLDSGAVNRSPGSGRDKTPGQPTAVEYKRTRRVIPDDKELKRNRVVAAFDNDPRVEVYRQLRTQILREFKINNWRTLAITSAHQGEGKTLTAINVAITLAKEVNHTVLLVDLDFQGPNIAERLGIELEAGLAEHLRGEAALEDILVNPGFERLVVAPAKKVQGKTSEILSSPAMQSTLEEMLARYSDRIIVFDLPPLLRDDDALVFIPYVDASLLVVEYGSTTPADTEKCMRLLNRANVLGTVLNKVGE